MKHLENFNGNKNEWLKECMRIIDMSIRLEDVNSDLHFDYRVGYITSQNSHSFPLYYDRKSDKLLGDDDHLNHAINTYAKLCISIDMYISDKYTPFRSVGDISYGPDNSDLLIKILNETNSIYSSIKNTYNRYVIFGENRVSVCFLKK